VQVTGVEFVFDWRAVAVLGIGLAAAAGVVMLVRRWIGQRTAPDTAPTAGFDAQLAERLARTELERELQQLRQEVAALRTELGELKAARNISPQYAEALALAQRGLSAREVAERMGISLAEAELVHALSRGERLFDEAGPQDSDDSFPDGR